jgi:hypothetical protein
MGTYKPGDSYYGFFSTQHSVTRLLSNADATPTSTVYHNGTSDASFSINVTSIATGMYRMTGLIPAGYAAGDKVNILASGAVSGIVGANQVDAFILDSKRAADYVDTNGRVDVINIGGTAATSVLETRVANVINTSVPTNFNLFSIDGSGWVNVSGILGSNASSVIDQIANDASPVFDVPTNFTSLVIDTDGRVDLSKILGTNASSLIKTIADDASPSIDVPVNFTSLSIDPSGWVTVSGILGINATSAISDAASISVSSSFDVPVNFTSLEIDSSGHVRTGRSFGAVSLEPI